MDGGAWWAAVHGVAKSRTWLSGFTFTFHFHALEKEMAASWAAVYGVAQSRTRLKRLSMHAYVGEGNGNPLQYSWLENPRDGGAWWAAVYGMAQSQTRLKRLSSSSIVYRVAKSQTQLARLSIHTQFWKKINGSFLLNATYYREGNGTPLQYSCLENPMDGGAW